MLNKTIDYELKQGVINLLSALKYGGRLDAVKQLKMLLECDIKGAVDELNLIIGNLDKLKPAATPAEAATDTGQYVVITDGVSPVSKQDAVREARRNCMDQYYDNGAVYIARLVSRVTVETKEEPVT